MTLDAPNMDNVAKVHSQASFWYMALQTMCLASGLCVDQNLIAAQLEQLKDCLEVWATSACNAPRDSAI